MHTILNDDLVALRDAFNKAGFDVRLVGGCVRDLLMGVAPKDVDLCTDATPDEQVAVYKANGFRYVETGLQHGTVTVVLNHVAYEVTSLRIDTDHDGRHATVLHTRDWVEDLSRRDLTVNAMMLTFDGTLVDPFNGKADLEARVVRFVGNPVDRMREDYLRILRWLRFHGRLNPEGALDADTAKAVMQEKAGLDRISRERVWAEVSKTVAGPAGPAMLRALLELGLAEHVGLVHTTKTLKAFEVAWTNTRNPVTLMVAYVGYEQANLPDVWKWSGEERDLFNFLLRTFVVGLDDYKALLARDGVSKDWVLELARLNNDADWVPVLEAWDVPTFPVRGADLLAAGMKPGKAVGERLTKMKTVWTESKFVLTKDELMETVP